MIDVLVSTYGKSSKYLFQLKNRISNNVSVVVIHQQPIKEEGEKLNNIYSHNYFTSNEIGLSKSRNLAIAKAKNDYCLIADDDTFFSEDFESKIIESFNKYPEADIITFKISTPEGEPFKNYSKKKFWYNKRKVFKASSIEMAFKLKSIKAAKLRFDENFGLGAKYVLGEEAIFLSDAIDKGLKILYLPINIVFHSYESSGKVYSKENLQARGAQIARIFGYYFLMIDLAFFIKIKLKSRKRIPLKYLFEIFKGSLKYFKNQ